MLDHFEKEKELSAGEECMFFHLNVFFFCQETQLQHEVTMKNDLLQKFLKDQELDEHYQLTNRSDEESRRSVLTCIPAEFVTYNFDLL